jgi:hypothetical protein
MSAFINSTDKSHSLILFLSFEYHSLAACISKAFQALIYEGAKAPAKEGAWRNLSFHKLTHYTQLHGRNILLAMTLLRPALVANSGA